VGHGRTLVLLHGGLVSASEAFAATPISYAGHLERLAQTFRVIAPDTRAAGGTRHPGGPASATLLCDDVAALIEALGLDRPLVAGFSEGGLTALLLGIRHPAAAGAIVSDAGYDTLNPDAPAFGLLRQMLGDGDPDEADPTTAHRALSQDPQMARVLGMLEAEVTERQGGDAWPM
jgi:pimeloyl-ACP methyl ester carboxylesterase